MRRLCFTVDFDRDVNDAVIGKAAAISMGIAGHTQSRPMTHDLIISLLHTLDATIEGVSIVDVHNTTFYAHLMLRAADGHVFEVRVERLEDSFELVDEQQFDDVESDEATE